MDDEGVGLTSVKETCDVVVSVNGNLMKEKLVSADNIYQLELPDGFIFQKEDGVFFIYKEENGKGVISISNYEIPSNYVFEIVEELKDFINTAHDSFDLGGIEIIKSDENAYCDFIVNGRFWKVWTLVKNPYAVFASYNCDEKDRYLELDEMNVIINSLEILL